MSRGQFPRLGCSLFLLSLALALPLFAALMGALPAGKIHGPQAPQPGLSSLPAAAQASISAALGRDQRAYHAMAHGKAWRLRNARHGLWAVFTPRGIQVQAGAARFGLQLMGLGRGARIKPESPVKPVANANCIEYRRSGLTEWYVNGPLGLEHGFSLDRPPPRTKGEALTLVLQLAGDVTVVADRKGDGVALQAPEGRTLLRYRGLIAWDATGRTLSAWWTVVGGEVRLRVDDTRARYPLTIDPVIEDARLIASDATAGDFFGESVAIDGDTVVVGANLNDIGSNSAQGSAYVFVKPPGGWAGPLHESANLTASDGAAVDFFGQSVAVNGDTVVVGADTAGPNGAAYVFVKPAGGWAGPLQESAKLTASDGAVADFFGQSVAVNGDTVVVGALHDEIGGNESRGSAYVFVKPAGGWVDTTETAKLTASDGAAEERFGESVAVSADTIVVGKFLGGNSRQGPAYVFVKLAGGWVDMTETAQLTASDGEPDSLLGEAVAVSGDTVVVGGFPAYVFVKPTDGWAGLRTESAKLSAGGLSVAVSGDTVVVHESRFVKPVGGWAGVVRENAVHTPSDGSPADAFGFSVGVSGDTVVVGAPFKENNQGSAYVFVAFEAEPAQTQVNCGGARCKLPITCNLPPDLGTRCRNRINLFAFVRRGSIRMSDDTLAKAPRTIRFAFGISNIPPGETKNLRFRLTPRGRKIAQSGKRRLRGVLEIRNTPGDLIDSTQVRIRLR